MRRFLCRVAVFAIVAVPISLRAPIQGSNELSIDFANEEDARAKAEWSHPDKLTFTAAGLGREEKSWDSDWIQTKPIAVGLFWRVPSGVTIEVKILPPPKAHHRFENGKEIWSSADDLYARYSPDFKHWSSWQVLHRDEKNSKVGVFAGEIAIPERERQKYQRYIDEYQKLDVPWTGNEEAIVDWILKKEPDFFGHSLPLIGYVQFLFEPSTFESWRIKSFEATILFGVSGFAGPKDPSVVRDQIPWRFKAP